MYLSSLVPALIGLAAGVGLFIFWLWMRQQEPSNLPLYSKMIKLSLIFAIMFFVIGLGFLIAYLVLFVFLR